MTTTSTLYRWRRLIPLALGACAMLAMVVVFALEADAQAKKDDPNADKADKAEKKDAPEPEVKTEANFKDKLVDQFGGVEQVAYINELIEKAWKDNKIQPSKRCTDHEFIRRASLDIVGRIATVDEIKTFFNEVQRHRSPKGVALRGKSTPKHTAGTIGKQRSTRAPRCKRHAITGRWL